MISIRDVSTPGSVELVLYRDGWFIALVVRLIDSARLGDRGAALREAITLLRATARRERHHRRVLRDYAHRHLAAIRGDN